MNSNNSVTRRGEARKILDDVNRRHSEGAGK